MVRATLPLKVFSGNSLMEIVAVCPALILPANVCGTLMKIRSVSIRAIWKRPPLPADAFVPDGVVPLPGIVVLEGVVPVEALTLLVLGLINEPTSTFRAVITPAKGE